MNNLAQLYGEQGNDAAAEPLLKQAIAIFEQAMGLDSSMIAAQLTNLAALYQRQERYADAEPLFRRALVIREKSLGRDRPEVGQALNNLATWYEKQGRTTIPNRCLSARWRSTKKRQAPSIPRSRHSSIISASRQGPGPLR